MIYGKRVLIAFDQLCNALFQRVAAPDHRRVALLEGRALPAGLREGTKRLQCPPELREGG